MIRALLLFAGAGALAVGAGALSLAACTTDTGVVGLVPVTGIVVRSSSLVAGFGCGPGLTQVFKYAVVVTSADGQSSWGGLYNCFADAEFVALPSSDAGTYVFRVDVYAFNAASAAVTDLDAGAPAANAAPDVATLAANATWVAHCSATQQPNVEVLAVCGSLVPGTAKASATLDTSSFPRSNGERRCNVGYKTVQVSYPAFGSTPAGTKTATCPAPITLDGIPVPSVLDLGVTLTVFNGEPGGTTTCHAAAGAVGAAAVSCDDVTLPP